MSLPPETVKLLLDFSAAVGSFLYVVGGYFLGKWQSDESLVTLWAGQKEIVIWMMDMETMRKDIYDMYRQDAHKRGKELSPLPFEDMDYMIQEEREKLDEGSRKIKRSAKRSKWMGIDCVAVGTVLFAVNIFLVRLML